MDASTNIMELQHQIKYAKVAKQYKQAQALEDELHRLKHLQEDQQMQVRTWSRQNKHMLECYWSAVLRPVSSVAGRQ